MARTLRVRTPDMHEPIINLSGGNQQKVLIARWLLTKPKILILDEPTRGIDVGAKAEIHRLISKLAGEGVAVIMISSEMPEVLGMSDRIMVVHEGRVTGFLDRDGSQSGQNHGTGVALDAQAGILKGSFMSTTENEAGASTTGLKSVRRLPPEVSILAVLIRHCLVFEVLGWIFVGESFLANKQRLSIIVLQVSVIGIIAVGVTQVIITGWR